jgi:hypothetical protein
MEGSVEYIQIIMESKVSFSLKEFYLYLKLDDLQIPTAFIFHKNVLYVLTLGAK